VKWENVHKVIETETLISVYVDKARAMTFPKDQISVEQTEWLTNLIRNKIDKRKCKIK
jgi:hypothetical protein